MSTWGPALVWAIIALAALMAAQRWIHRHLRGVTLLLAGQERLALILYALVLFPGVLLHEVSHYVAAWLLGLKPAAISLWPKAQADGSIQLGYVIYRRPRHLDPVRESIIGGAPLITGLIALGLIGQHIFQLEQPLGLLRGGNLAAWRPAVAQLFQTQDFFLWLYLVFAISNAMLPSPSDRRAWPGLALWLAILITLLVVTGLGNWLWPRLDDPLLALVEYLGLALGLTLAIDGVGMIVLAGLEWLLGRLTGARIHYS